LFLVRFLHELWRVAWKWRNFSERGILRPIFMLGNKIGGGRQLETKIEKRGRE